MNSIYCTFGHDDDGGGGNHLDTTERDTLSSDDDNDSMHTCLDYLLDDEIVDDLVVHETESGNKDQDSAIDVLSVKEAAMKLWDDDESICGRQEVAEWLGTKYGSTTC